MSSEPSAQASPNETIDRLRRRFTEDVDEAEADWFDAYARAFVEADAERCEQLAAEPFAFPDTMARLVAERFAPAAQDLRSSRWTGALDRLTRDSGRAGAFVRSLALEGGSTESRTEVWREIVANALKGVWLEDVGRPGAAGAAYAESGKYFGEEGTKYDASLIELLERACELDPRHPVAYWYLADAWRVRSIAPAPPYVHREPLEKSVDVWNRGAAAHLPDADSSWAYLLRALLSEQRARLDENQPVLLWWEAILYLERAILLSEADAGRWAALGRCHRLVGNDQNALYATAKALEQNADDAAALEERAAIVAESGMFAEALKAIDRRIALDEGRDNPWALGLKAYVLAHQHEYQAARELIDRVIAVEPDNLWNFDVKATCCWMLGDKATALDLYRTILAAAGSRGDRVIRAFAAYRLGRIDEAIALFEPLFTNRLSGEQVSRVLGLCYLVIGDVSRGEDMILDGLTRATTRELNDFLAWELSGVDLSEGSAGMAVLSRIKILAAALAERSRGVLTGSAAAALEELLGGSRSEPARVTRDSVAIAAARAGLARLQVETGRWRDAAASYAELRGAPTHFPEAPVGLSRILAGVRIDRQKPLDDQLPSALERFAAVTGVASAGVPEHQTGVAQGQLGEMLWRAGRGPDALDHLRTALARVATGDARDKAAAHARLALALEIEGHRSEAREHHASALRIYLAIGGPEPGEALAEACRPFIRSVGECWTMHDAWRRLAGEADRAADTRSSFDRASTSLLAYLDDACGLTAPLEAEVAKTWIAPVTLQVGSAIVPLVDPASDRSRKGKFLNEDIPAMRERISRNVGMPNLPGILVRPQPATVDEYDILLEGATAARGRVRVGETFVAELPGAAGAEVAPPRPSAVEDPSTGVPGRWYPAAVVKSETVYMLSHVEAVLRRHLAMFLGLDDTRALLLELKKNAARQAFATSLLDDQQSVDMLTRVFRLLLDENVPLTDWPTIVEAITRSGLASVGAAVREIRLGLKTQLPGNADGTTYLQVPPAWERSRDQDGDGLIGARPEVAHRHLVSVRTWLQSCSDRVALVVQDPPFRPVLRRLIKHEFPGVAVLSHEEVLRPERIAPAETGPTDATSPEKVR